MNKRACGDVLFSDTFDRLFFLSLVAEAVRTTKIEIHAYCLMGNHFHLLIRTPEPTLDEAMRLIGGKYARYFNDRRERDGGVCRGRYRAILIDSERYLLAVSRYIHRNPVALGVTSLADYGWSSYSAFLGARPPQEWLSLTETLELAGGSAKYEALVESLLPSEIEKFYNRQNAPSIIGTPEFRAWVQQKGVRPLSR
jgi:putative transposase